MAELLHIGERCHACNQLDFLPLKCKNCSLFFCRFHSRHDQHNCEETTLKISNNLDTISADKKEHMYNYKCSKSGCQKRELVSIKCVECNKEFCILHRHPMDHICDNPVLVSQGVQHDRSITKKIDTAGVSTKEPIYNYKCSKFGCKKAEAVPVKCSECKREFCVIHKHPMYHICDSPALVSQGVQHDRPITKKLDTAGVNTKERIYNYKCSKPGCKESGPFSIRCSECKREFCVFHKHHLDHVCDKNKRRQIQTILRRYPNCNCMENDFKTEPIKKRFQCCIIC